MAFVCNNDRISQPRFSSLNLMKSDLKRIMKKPKKNPKKKPMKKPMNCSEMKMAHIDNIARISQPCSQSMAGPESSCSKFVKPMKFMPDFSSKFTHVYNTALISQPCSKSMACSDCICSKPVRPSTLFMQSIFINNTARISKPCSNPMVPWEGNTIFSASEMAYIDKNIQVPQRCSNCMYCPEGDCKFRGGKKLIYPGKESDNKLLHKAANAAITDYNKRMNTNFKPVRVLKSHVLVTGGLECDIKFEAQDETQVPAYFMATVWLKVANEGAEVNFCCPYFEHGSEFVTESLDFSQEFSGSSMEEVELVDHMIDG